MTILEGFIKVTLKAALAAFITTSATLVATKGIDYLYDNHIKKIEPEKKKAKKKPAGKPKKK